jgi:amino acid transporter
MPIGILASLVVCTILYVVVATVLTGMVSYKELTLPHRWPWRWTSTRACTGWVSVSRRDAG